MRPTRRTRTVAACAGGCGLLAVVLDRPVLLAGVALLGAWLLARQYRFVRELVATERTLAVAQTPARNGAQTGESVPVTLDADLDRPTPLSLSVDAGLPTGATPAPDSGAADRSAGAASTTTPRIDLGPGETRARATIPATWPVAGRHRFERATATASDGLFRERFPVGSTPTVTVEPRGPRSIHVGAGGDRIATAHGAHRAGRFGAGIEPAELREYVDGDTADRIDWKATARLDTPHVREREAETDRTTLLLVDHRASLAVGPPAETALESLREVALATAASARRLGDPLGLVAVGDEGVTTRFAPGTSADRYAAVRRALLELEPTTAGSTRPDAGATSGGGPATVGRAVGDGATMTDDEGAAMAGDEGMASGDAGATGEGAPTDAVATASTPAPNPSADVKSPDTRDVALEVDGSLPAGPPRAPTDARAALAALDAGAVGRENGGREGERRGSEAADDAFARALRPFYEARRTYRERYASAPLVGAVQSATAGHRRDPGWTVCFTDDSRPRELREAIRGLRAAGSEVTLLLAPASLFAADGLADLEAAYDRYVAFEAFRRDLDRIDGVTALEVAPGDRLSTVLAAGRSRARPGAGGEPR